MLLTLQNVFDSFEELCIGKWTIPTSLNYSIEAIRFLNEILRWNRDYRPFPDELMSHPYFKTNTDKLAKVKEQVPNLR